MAARNFDLPEGLTFAWVDQSVEFLDAVSSEPLRKAPWTEFAPGCFKREALVSAYVTETVRVCADCKIPKAIQFSPIPEVDLEAKVTENLCLPCYEKRLGRKLTLKDLTPGCGNNALAFHVHPDGTPVTEDPYKRFVRKFSESKPAFKMPEVDSNGDAIQSGVVYRFEDGKLILTDEVLTDRSCEV